MVVPPPPSYPPTGMYVASNAGYREAALGTKTIRGQIFQIFGFQKNRPKKFYRFKNYLQHIGDIIHEVANRKLE